MNTPKPLPVDRIINSPQGSFHPIKCKCELCQMYKWMQFARKVELV